METMGDLGQRRQQRNGAAWREIYDRYRPVAPLDGACHIAYLHAPLFNPALKAVAPIRKSFRSAQLSSTCSARLVNPVMPTYQLLGVYNLPLLRLYSYTYQESGTRFVVVHSLDGYDEISLTAEFKVAMPEKEKLYTPEMLGFSRTTEAELDGGETVAEAACIFDDVLNNRATPAQKNCVIANSAFAIQVICRKRESQNAWRKPEKHWIVVKHWRHSIRLSV